MYFLLVFIDLSKKYAKTRARIAPTKPLTIITQSYELMTRPRRSPIMKKKRGNPKKMNGVATNCFLGISTLAMSPSLHDISISAGITRVSSVPKRHERHSLHTSCFLTSIYAKFPLTFLTTQVSVILFMG